MTSLLFWISSVPDLAKLPSIYDIKLTQQREARILNQSCVIHVLQMIFPSFFHICKRINFTKIKKLFNIPPNNSLHFYGNFFSLLKVHLQLRGFTVFLDIEKLAAGRFDDRLLNSVKQARNFILVLTPGALERCIHDDLNKDWVHRVSVTWLK